MALLCFLNWLFLLHLVSGIKETTVDLIESQGYPAEVHFVTTNDGYILTVHRIPRPGAPVVFYQHGYESSSADVVLGPSNTTLGFLMSDLGFGSPCSGSPKFWNPREWDCDSLSFIFNYQFLNRLSKLGLFQISISKWLPPL